MKNETKKRLEDYYYAWTVEGLTEHHTDVALCKEWLQDEDIWSDKDRKFLGKMTDEELTIFAKNLAAMAKENLTKEINLIGKVIIDSYVDLTTGDCADGEGFFITNDDKMVADVYVSVASFYMELLQSHRYEVTGHGIRCEGKECLYYVSWLEKVDHDDDIEHEETIALYVNRDDDMILIPYSHDPVEAARYLELPIN